MLRDNHTTWNVLSEKKTKEITGEVLERMAQVVSRTFGPFGSNTIIEDPSGHHHMTKDGFTVLKQIRFQDPIRKTLAKMMYDISFNLVVKVGDGSTSSIIAANSIYKRLNEWLSNNGHIRRKLVSQKIEFISELLEKEIYKRSIEVGSDFEEIKSIASIATNNDEGLGELIADTYKKISRHGKIKVFQSQSDKTYVDIERGFRVTGTLADKKLISDYDTMSNVLKDANVLMIHGSLADIDSMESIARLIQYHIDNDDKLVILTNGYGQMVSQFITDKIIGTNEYMGARLAFLYMPLLTSEDVECFRDLELYLDCKAIDTRGSEEKFDFERDFVKENVLGHAELVESKMGGGDNCIFYGGRGMKTRQSDIEERVERIRGELAVVREENSENLVESMVTLKLESRLLNFSESGGVAKLFVGGKTPMEKSTAMYLIEDAVKASESALRYGYNIGCNLIIPIVINEIIESNKELDSITLDLLEVVRESFRDVMKSVVANMYEYSTQGEDLDFENTFSTIFNTCVTDKSAYDLINGVYTDKEIINSSRTDVEILKATLSIIGLILLSNQFLSLNPITPLETEVNIME